MVRKTLGTSAALLAFLALSSQSVNAVEIRSSVANEAGAKWVYSYTLNNNSLGAGVSEFRILFALGDFADLEVAASAADWDSIVADPDPGLPDDGFFDSLSLFGPLPLGNFIGGFQVRFTWLGNGTPGSQPFSILDPETFESLFDGRTALDGIVQPPPSGVPDPGTFGLFAISLFGLAWATRRTVS